MQVHLLSCFVLFICTVDALKCPKGLQCATAAQVQNAETVAYLGAPPTCSQGGPPLALCQELSVYFNIVGAAIPSIAKFETPIVIRTAHVVAHCAWNALTAFNPTAKPTGYIPGMGLPFSSRLSGEAAGICNKNTALAYAMLRAVEALIPAAVPSVNSVFDALDLDTSYTNTADHTDPRDIGNTAARATLSYFANDGYNANGLLDAQAFPRNFSDYTNFVPANTPYLLEYITKWQPLIETNGLGYFTVQTHITPQSALAKTFAVTSKEMKTKYISLPPYPPTNELNMNDYKDQADQVLKVASTLTDLQKVWPSFSTRNSSRLGLFRCQSTLLSTSGIL